MRSSTSSDPRVAGSARRRGGFRARPARSMLRGLGGGVLAAALALGGILATPPLPAAADGPDPTIVTELTGVAPALPAGVTVQVRTSLAPQVVLANPTPEPVTALGPDGVPFLRVSSAGVEGNVTSPFFHVTLNPPSGPPPRIPAGAAPGAAPRWAPLSTSDAWGWFDPRLSPEVRDSGPAEDDPTQQAVSVLARWRIDLVRGSTPTAVTGEVQRRPVLGRFDAVVDPTPGIPAVVVPGTVPAMYVPISSPHTVEVLGRNGQPWLRSGPAGIEADRGSAEFREDRAGRGEDAPPGVTGWAPLAGPGSALTWLDPRLAWTSDVPPEDALRASGPTDLGHWRIPLRVDGVPVDLTGTVRWLPSSEVLAQQGQDDPTAGSPWLSAALVAGGLLLVVALWVLVRRTRRAREARGGTPPGTGAPSGPPPSDPPPSDPPPSDPPPSDPPPSDPPPSDPRPSGTSGVPFLEDHR